MSTTPPPQALTDHPTASELPTEDGASALMSDLFKRYA